MDTEQKIRLTGAFKTCVRAGTGELLPIELRVVLKRCAVGEGLQSWPESALEARSPDAVVRYCPGDFAAKSRTNMCAPGRLIVNQIVPPTLLFDYRMQVPVCPDPSRKKTGRLLKLDDAAQLPMPGTMDGSPSFSTLHAGWNPNGLGITATVRGRTQALTGEPNQLGSSDCIELWIDTRPTGNVHRATGYCHRLACLPSDRSAGGNPSAVPLAIPQQREVRGEIQTRHIQLRAHLCQGGYDLEVWIPESQLYGFRQIDELRQLGFYCLVRDTELGEQPLTVSDEFPFAWDPSLWVNLELTDE